MTDFEGVCDALATGAVLAIVLPRLRAWPAFTRLLASPLLLLLFPVVFVANLQREHPHFFWLACIPLMNISVALIVARYVERPDLGFGRLLNTRAAVAIGTLSYSLYLWQELFLVQWRPPVSVWQEFPLNVIGAVACAVASYKLVEQPFLKLKARFEPARAVASAGPLDEFTKSAA
jgi:peptidoglycan/LPS O-acetylase OafA/YrhL